MNSKEDKNKEIHKQTHHTESAESQRQEENLKRSKRWARAWHHSLGYVEVVSHVPQLEGPTTRIYNYVLGGFGEEKKIRKKIGARDKLHYKGTSIESTVDFSTETVETRKHGDDILKVLKE